MSDIIASPTVRRLAMEMGVDAVMCNTAVATPLTGAASSLAIVLWN